VKRFSIFRCTLPGQIAGVSSPAERPTLVFFDGKALNALGQDSLYLWR